MPTNIVQEVQGLYGPFSVSEKIIQKIWLRGDYYQENLRTTSGKCLKVLDPGRWNMNEGPDFQEACLEIDGQKVFGDVEIHFHANDWFSHGHDVNPNFMKVVLHVVLYDPSEKGWDARLPIESLVLMPLLERDLEEYVMEAALLDLEQVNELEWFERFASKTLSERRFLIEKLSSKRWAQKSSFAAKRLARANWAQCCHESTLEVMGFARNRGVMHQIASCYTITDFSRRVDLGQVYEEFRDAWKLSGCRPANHPKLRLKQYARICSANPDWPNLLLGHLKAAKAAEVAEPGEFRKAARTKALQALIAEEVFQGMIGSKRLNTLLCDAIFPLVHTTLAGGWDAHWQHWYPGDFPDAFARFYRQAGFTDARIPMTNGLMQGILILFASKGDVLD